MDETTPPPDHSDYTPDFELPRHGAVREDNWAELQAKGITSTSFDFDYAQGVYGVGNVYTGDAFSEEDGRPLRHKPGVGVYVTPEGRRHAEEEWREIQRERAEWEQREAGSMDAEMPPPPPA